MLICQDTRLYTMTHLLMQEEVAKYLSKQIQYEVLTEMHMGISGMRKHLGQINWF